MDAELKQLQIDVTTIISDPPSTVLEIQVLTTGKLMAGRSLQPNLARRSLTHRCLTAPGTPCEILPDDILCEIFLLCLPSNRWEVTPNPSKTPTVLTLVCKRWRSASLAFPLLWCWMKLCPPKKIWKNRKVCRRAIKNFRDVLGRSKSAPLNLMLRSEIVEMEDVTINTFLARTLQAASRSLTRLALFTIPVCQLGALPSGIFPALQSLVFCMADSGEDGKLSTVVAFRDAPSLRRVVLDTSFDAYSGKQRFALPWRQLTHFLDCDEYHPCTSLFTRHIIEQKPQLRWLGLDVSEEETEEADGGPWEHPAGLDPLSMDTVVTLALNFQWQIGYLGLFDWVTFPNLRTLRLNATEADSLDGHADRFLAQLQMLRKLEFLSIKVNTMNPHLLESMLKAVPTVHTLDLFLGLSYCTVFQLLETNKELLPRLHTLALVLWARQDRISAPDLQRLLDARTPGTHPTSRIRKLILRGEKPSDFSDEREFVQVIRKFVEIGDLVFEWQVGELEERNAKMWMEMDPSSQGWEEAGEAAHFLATVSAGSDLSGGEDWDDDGAS